jgi:ketosteroid isomerase-like protein
MKKTRFLLCLLCVAVALRAAAQSKYKQQLDEINRQITEAWLQRDAAALASFYSTDAVSMPEYHLTLFGKRAISDYLRQWMDSVKVQSYQRKTYDITEAGAYLVETGTFDNRFLFRNNTTDNHGKYLAVWRIGNDDKLKLLSEITGSVKPVERGELPLSALSIPDTAALPKPKDNETKRTLQRLYDEVAEFVVQRKGSAFAPYYASDAVYMPYFMPMLIGKPAIDSYYREHEDPSAKIMDVHINATRIIETRDYVLSDCYYWVTWGDSAMHGTVTGKNITVFKRGTDGRLLIYRQMALHD